MKANVVQISRYLLCVSFACALMPVSVIAAEGKGRQIEEVIVTAERSRRDSPNQSLPAMKKQEPKTFGFLSRSNEIDVMATAKVSVWASV